MNMKFNPKIKQIATLCPQKLYAVGGCVRNFLLGESNYFDVDLCSATPFNDFVKVLNDCKIETCGVYKRTGTVMFMLDNVKYEFTTFRTEKYSNGGEHSPIETAFTTDIYLDAIRRDFKCNAVYYDIVEDKFCDVLGGIKDIENRVIDTVVCPDEVFCHDGLRLMRLARFCAELKFTPTNEVLISAKKNAKNINDISSERILEELKRILCSDTKYTFSNKDGHYLGLKVLHKIGVLDNILGELTKGDGMLQRSDYHDHDVLEHSLRCVKYAEQSVRFYALLHDIGKPASMEKYNNFWFHDKEGERLAQAVCQRLKTDKETEKEAMFIAKYHMLDMDCNMKTGKLRLFIVKNYKYIDHLLLIKQADFSASKDCLNECKTVGKWKKLIETMKNDGTPFCIKDLKITSKELIEFGYCGKKIKEEQEKLFLACITNPQMNDKEKLIELAKKQI